MSEVADFCGILSVDKPAGMTSHDVVAAVRRITGQRRVGHAGTLDPLATGLLLLCLGQATRVVEYLRRGRKVYLATVQLGVATDTYDATGQVVAVAPVGDLSRAQIEEPLAEFVGHIEQKPPVYSAIKSKGTPLYKLARQGRAVSPPPRQVEIEAIELLAWDAPDLVLLVSCGPGTYIRSLAHDLGQRLGTGGHLTALRRLSSGHWRVEDALALDEVAGAFQKGLGPQILHPLDEALWEFAAVALDDEQAALVRHGRNVSLPVPAGDSMLRAYAPTGEFLALLEPGEDEGPWHPVKVFA
jgi:tRNA pseudouridine55 synthase